MPVLISSSKFRNFGTGNLVSGLGVETGGELNQLVGCIRRRSDFELQTDREERRIERRDERGGNMCRRGSVVLLFSLLLYPWNNRLRASIVGADYPSQLRLRGGSTGDCPSIASLDREASKRWHEKKDEVLQWEDSPRLSDKEVGIREYVRRKKKGKGRGKGQKRKGTGGILKAMWSDFRFFANSTLNREI